MLDFYVIGYAGLQTFPTTQELQWRQGCIKKLKLNDHKQAYGIRNIEVKLEELRDVCDEFGAAIESLRSKVEVYTIKFHEEVTAPW
ncbi:B3 domain-containing protein-like [Prunus yedoensis var. nudiflora]|uniref:B3 domain-containing protein-like n=1 Tax=Prunus yedoensis var. nudiflora TaxID=2094558 RepID=A0A314YL46_PRUYE|nr:B3 domain-containing protein-like [Prunus yedoensis var. nudiflora]